jgi:acyl-CoA dehydrogenase
MEHTFQLVWESRPVVAKLRKAIKDETLAEAPLFELIDPAVESGLIDAAEAAQLRDALAAREDLIQVDSFTLQEYLGLAPARAHRTEGPKGVCVSA